MSLYKHWLPLALSSSLAACGGDLSGEYGEGSGADWEPVMSFKGSEVELTEFGQTLVGSYELKGDKVHITANGETQAFAIDEDGCIDGGTFIGRLCKKP
jgi:hypothetical protein